MKWILIICLAVLAGCEFPPPAWREVRMGETAKVYACGPWNPAQVEQFPAVLEDYNSKIGHENGRPFFVFGGQKEGLVYRGENTSSLRCVWWVWGPSQNRGSDYPTAEGQALWRAHFDWEGEGPIAGLYDGEGIFLFRSKNCFDGGELPECEWRIASILAHELGHALGGEHLPDPDPEDPSTKGVLTTPVSSEVLRLVDGEEICRHVSCKINRVLRESTP